MRDRFKVTIRVWPFANGERSDIAQTNVGGEHQEFEVDADGFDAALIRGRDILTGIRANPAVWQADIRAIIPLNPVS